MNRSRAYLLAWLLAAFATPPLHAQTITDALYNSHHPRLLVSAASLPALAAKLQDGGIDDATYTGVRQLVTDSYPHMTTADVLGAWYGDQAIPCVGLVGQLESDSTVMAFGKSLTLYIADTYEPDSDEAASGMRLRALAIGYDMCFKYATEAERGRVRDEMVRYMQKMEWTPGYRFFEQQPYLGNHSAMFGAALGLASIALQGEAESYLLSDGLAMTDRIVGNLLRYQFDPDGAYNEGAFYAAWTLKQLVYYFDARQRFDGRSYADNPQLRSIEAWFAYEIAPEGGGHSFNLNDSPQLSAPLAQQPAFFNWAMSAWNSGLSAWLWRHTAGDLGMNVGASTDWAGTILWNRPLATTEPGATLPASRVWSQRGLFYYRSGWPSGASSGDVVFSFYSGKFQGGHAQEDQNQFALCAYGTAFAIDHGIGVTAKESESHNMVFIDGKGQHNAGSSIGTDGAITDFLLGSFADVVTGDATAAYTTYSEFNAPNYPVQGTDWSWGYSGANPVLFARRTVVTVHGSATPFYALVMDDIDKDGTPHNYEWRMHTPASNTVDVSVNPILIAGSTARMDMYLVSPEFSSVTAAAGPYTVDNTDPASTLLRITKHGVNPAFTLLCMPRANGVSAPGVATTTTAWGCAATIDWGGGAGDVVLRNDSGGAVSYGDVTTDAAVVVVRRNSGVVDSYMMANGRSLVLDGTPYVSLNDGPASCEFSASTVRLNRFNADFRILDTGVSRVLYHEQNIGFALDSGYVIPDGVTGVGTSTLRSRVDVHAWPNPFNPAATISVTGVTHGVVRVDVYDVSGRRVRSLWSGVVRGTKSWVWNGRNDVGTTVSSGTYFVRVTTPAQTRTVKLTLVK